MGTIPNTNFSRTTTSAACSTVVRCISLLYAVFIASLQFICLLFSFGVCVFVWACVCVCPPPPPLPQDRQTALESWGFQCSCTRCLDEIEVESHPENISQPANIAAFRSIHAVKHVFDVYSRCVGVATCFLVLLVCLNAIDVRAKLLSSTRLAWTQGVF